MFWVFLDGVFWGRYVSVTGFLEDRYGCIMGLSLGKACWPSLLRDATIRYYSASESEPIWHISSGMIVLNQWFLVTSFLWTWHAIEWWLLSHIIGNLGATERAPHWWDTTNTFVSQAFVFIFPRIWVFSASTSASVNFQGTCFAYSTFNYCTFLHGYNGPSCEHHFPLGVGSDADCQCQSHRDSSHTRQCKNFFSSWL